MAPTQATASVDKLGAARRLIACAAIDGIRLLRTTANNSVDLSKPPDGMEPLSVTIEFSAEGRPTPPQKLSFVVEYKITAKRPSGRESEVELGCAFELLYSIPDEVKPTQEEIQAFADTNVVYNSWPYWREFVQNTITRMGLPPLTLPLFRVVPSVQKQDAGPLTEAVPRMGSKRKPRK